MNRIAQIFPLLLLATLGLLTFWLNEAVQRGGRTASTERHDPDYIIDGVVARRMDTDGRIKNTLHAERLTHYPDDDSTLLTQPKFVSYATAVAPLTVTAQTARLPSGGEDIYFETNVRAVRAAYNDHSEMVLQTAFLHVLPDKNIAQTDRPVTLTDANTVARAIGLELNSETRTLTFLSQFRSTLRDPQHTADGR